jgi:hypothetical protein
VFFLIDFFDFLLSFLPKFLFLDFGYVCVGEEFFFVDFVDLELEVSDKTLSDGSDFLNSFLSKDPQSIDFFEFFGRTYFHHGLIELLFFKP